jgi:proline dehydrogenase
VELDMEDSTTTTATLDVYTSLRREGFDNLVIALQAYLRRTLADVRALAPLTPKVRLVKGIWIEPATVAYTDYDTIRANYARLLDELWAGGSFVAIASHDEWLHWRALELIDRHGAGRDRYEFQMLLGVREHLGDALVADGHAVRVYVPYGADWHAYSVRRFQENPRLARHVAADLLSRARRRVPV